MKFNLNLLIIILFTGLAGCKNKHSFTPSPFLNPSTSKKRYMPIYNAKYIEIAKNNVKSKSFVSKTSEDYNPKDFNANMYSKMSSGDSKQKAKLISKSDKSVISIIEDRDKYIKNNKSKEDSNIKSMNKKIEELENRIKSLENNLNTASKKDSKENSLNAESKKDIGENILNTESKKNVKEKSEIKRYSLEKDSDSQWL